MKEYKNPNYKFGKSSIKTFYTSNNVDTLGSTKIIDYSNNSSFFNRDKSFSDKGSKGISLFAFIILVLFIISFSHYIRTGAFIDFSFKSLIDYLSTMPDISISFAKLDLTIYGDWGVFDFLRSFFNVFTGLTEVAIQITGMIGQAFIVIGFLVGLIFI